MNTTTDGAHLGPVANGSGPRLEQPQISAETAALESVSTTLLMPGEDPSSPYLKDAEHWLAVYSEIYNFTVGIVGRFHAGIPDLQEPVQDYLRSHDVLVHEKQIHRFAKRIAFWRQRAVELRSASDGSGVSRTAAR